jgi:sensor c-di-GMP phosphodiesterase-like protein
MDCVLGQGWLLSRPLSEEQLVEYLAGHFPATRAASQDRA